MGDVDAHLLQLGVQRGLHFSSGHGLRPAGRSRLLQSAVQVLQQPNRVIG